MKKQRKQLNLNRETLRSLEMGEVINVAGGVTDTPTQKVATSCNTCSCQSSCWP
jgi:hypothetical protein